MTFFVIVKNNTIVRFLYSEDYPVLEDGEMAIEFAEKFDIANHAVIDGCVVGDISARTAMLQTMAAKQRKAEIEKMAIKAAVALLSPEIQAEYAELVVNV